MSSDTSLIILFFFHPNILVKGNFLLFLILVNIFFLLR